MTQWAMGGMLDPSMAGGFGADGIVFDGTNYLFINNFSTGKLIRIQIMGDGMAGTPDGSWSRRRSRIPTGCA